MPRLSKHILVGGATASGKSALALALAEETGAPVVNADALQVYDCWRILTARPTAEDEARARHLLYGHVPETVRYSVGAWLRDVAPIIARENAIIVGGTGLYLSSLLRGIAPVPPVPDAIREEGNALRARDRTEGFLSYLARHDPAILARIDTANPMRLQRAWEVHRATGTPLSVWQENTPNPLIETENAVCAIVEGPVEWLDDRIARRFAWMVEHGALDEVAAVWPRWSPDLPAHRALGATELGAFIDGRIGLEEAVSKGIIATRQFAKRQRTWFRSNMRDWRRVPAAAPVAAAAEALLAAAR